MRTPGKARKGSQQYEEYEDDEYSNKKEGPSSYNPNNNSSENNNNNNKDAKNNDKANVIRSKHSVTEQRRRSKINERFQILRDLIPHSDQKKDTASFLLEVIEYVQYLQENVQKYEGSYQGWTSEPTKLVPWRNSHWRVPSFIGHPQGMMNGSGSTPAFPVKFDENNVSITPTVFTNTHTSVESDPSRDIAIKGTDRQPEVVNKGITASMTLSPSICAPPVRSDSILANTLQVPVSDAQSIQCPTTGDTLNQHEDLVIEGGTISISSAYTQGLLNTLAQALQNAGLDLSQASVSVQIDLGKRANSELTSTMPISKDYENPSSSNQTVVNHRDGASGEESDHAQKRLKT